VPVVTATNLVRSFGDRRVLDGVSVSIHRGERVGVVGRNGSGKTTLARLLAGLETPDHGEVARRRDARIVYLSQQPDLVAGVSAREVALSGLEAWCRARDAYERASRALAAGDVRTEDLDSHIAAQARASEDLERSGGWDLVHRAEAVLGHLGIDAPDADVGRMSGGEQRRVALARVLIGQPDLAILDEPTNHLDPDTVDWLENYLIDTYSGALLLITHDRYILDRVATRTIELSDGALFSYDGGYETFLDARAERMAHDDRVESNRRNYLRTELEWLRRQPKARATKSQARIDRIEAAAATERPRAEKTAELTVAETRTGHTILELHDVAIDVAHHTLVRDLTLRLVQGERIGVVGPNGCGKTSLLRCIIGELEPQHGRVVRGANTRIAYLDQMRSDLDDSATVFDNVVGERGFVRVGQQDITPRSYLERFLFDGRRQREKVGSLSGGERARVALAKLLADPANLLLLDEPTNDLDVETFEALEGMLCEFGGTALVVTHDRYFLDRVATSVLAFEGEGRVVRHHGSYSEYRAAKAKPVPEPETAARRQREPAAEKRAKLSFAENREREALPDRIEALENAAAEIERQLADPDIYAKRGTEVAGFITQLERLRGEIESLLARWEELENRHAAQR